MTTCQQKDHFDNSVDRLEEGATGGREVGPNTIAMVLTCLVELLLFLCSLNIHIHSTSNNTIIEKSSCLSPLNRTLFENRDYYQCMASIGICSKINY